MVHRKMIVDAAASMASSGLRVLATASGSASNSVTASGGLGSPMLSSSLTFAGLIGLHDAPRDGVAQAVRIESLWLCLR